METLGETLSRADESPAGTGGKNVARLVTLLECDRIEGKSAVSDLSGLDAVLIGRGGRRVFDRKERQRLAIEVPDRRMSSNHVRLTRLHGRWLAEDAGSKNGMLINGQRLERAALGDGDLIEAGHTFFLFKDGGPHLDSRPDVDAADLRPPAPELATFVEPLRRQLADVASAAATELPVLILGETGTGKEVLARIVHRLSRRNGRFVAVNCGAIPQNLVESELFGVKQGAYSGADRDRPGLVKSADTGTLFLDELGDLPLVSQAALLRVLQEREVVPVGGTEPVPASFRLIAATHRDLQALLASARFRADLLARVSGLQVRIPALRERREDMGLLVASLLQRLRPQGASPLSLSPRAARALFTHDWPFNVRELEKTLAAAAVLAKEGSIGFEQLPESVRTPDVARRQSRPSPPAELSTDELKHKDDLIALLQLHQGNLSAMSRATGKARMQLHRWFKRYGIDPDHYRRSG